MHPERSRIAAGRADEELELNMTPMIDIVFQLIVFFLLSLKFKTVDERIESMLPKDRGRDPKPVTVPDVDKIKVKLFRRNVADPRNAFTLIRVDNAAQFQLPAGWRGRHRESPERVQRYERTLAAVRALVEERIRIFGGVPDALKGEIVAPPPSGDAVPHGDAVAVLDTFLQAGLRDVMFEGAAAPLNRRERAARRAAR